MPPQGESTGFAIEDAVLFAHILSHLSSSPITDIIARYEALRKPRMDEAFREAAYRWETTKDAGWIAFKLKEWLTPWFLWWTQGRREKGFAEDVRELVV